MAVHSSDKMNGNLALNDGGSNQNTLVFFVNGKKIEDKCVDPEWTLLYYLRNKLRLCGTKLGCGEGGCGACTVMVTKFDRERKKEIHTPVNACLAPVCSMHGLSVITVEGIGSTKTKLHPVQERIAKAHGSQCGFCTPGIVMSMYTLLRQYGKPTMKDMELAFQGNLCRCTGYRPIIEGFRTFTEEWELQQNVQKLNGNAVCGMGDKCCKFNQMNGNHDRKPESNQEKNCCLKRSNGITKTTTIIDALKQKLDENENPILPPETQQNALVKPSEFVPYDATQEPIFPPELKLSDKYDKHHLVIRGENVTWHRPTELGQLLRLKDEFPSAKIVVGNSEVGMEVKFKNMVYPVLIHPGHIDEMTRITKTERGVKIGAAATLEQIREFLVEEIGSQSETKTRLFGAIVEMLRWFAGKQIRSVGALGSNIMTGSPISDMIPILMAASVDLELVSKERGLRTVQLNNDFFIGYRKSIVKPSEILLTINVPYTNKDQYVYAYKQARRREDDITIVNSAVNVSFEPGTHIIQNIALAFGGMSFKTIMAIKTQTKLKGLPWNRETLETAYEYLLEDLPLEPNAPGGMVPYRKSLALSLFFKTYLAISRRLQRYVPDVILDDKELSGATGFHSRDPKSSQYFTIVPKTPYQVDSLQLPIVHSSAFKQATGEAIYCDDIPRFENELFMALVQSTQAHAKILSIDPSGALSMKGVLAFYSAKDMKYDRLNFGFTIVRDEFVFYSDTVTSYGQIVGVVIADSQDLAQKAAKKVKVEYRRIEPVIVTIEDAIKYQSFGPEFQKGISKGEVEDIMKGAPHVLEGECRIGGQEHFYLETQAAVVVPKGEDHEMEIYASTQNPTEVSKLVSKVLGIPQNRIICKLKRIGGGFGGKETKTALICIPAAFAAVQLGRPVRVTLEREEDMLLTGGRNPFLIKYKVAFDDRGFLLGVKADAYCNMGYSTDLSPSVLSRAVCHITNSYRCPAVQVNGYVCKTNLPSNTAFRGFGGPQGMFAAEVMMHHIADYLGKDVTELSEMNLYREGDVTPFNQTLVDCTNIACWEECKKMSNYWKRRKEVTEFNKRNRYKKRGLSMLPTLYGIGFHRISMNQGGALILVYTDGSVLLTHGGVEIGQGLYTKMMQVASRTLEIPMERIHISETSTDKVPNTSATAASTGSDLNGMAVMEACNVIKERLRPYKEANPEGTWEQWVQKAYMDRVSLSATGFYKTPDIEFDWSTLTGNLYSYFTYGAACSEVEIDTLTGDHQVIRTDIVMDLGESLNPAIDIGQIEGAFMQGYGLFTMEELTYSPEGYPFARGPGTYKLPGFSDIPAEFNVSILKGSSNPRAVYSSKAVGEPPLFLAASVFFAIRDAIKAARDENGVRTWFRLDSPATSAVIRMACQDSITGKIKVPEPGSFKPWSVTAEGTFQK